LLDDLQGEYGYRIEEIDITSREDLFARYRSEIPVLLRGEVELASGRVDERRLVAILEASAGAR
jgi:hypothetical protein